MQLLSKFNKRIHFLLCVIDIYMKYAWLMHLKDKKDTTITNALQNFLDESGRTPDKVWVDRVNKSSEFYNRSMKRWLEKKWYRNVFNT